MKSFELPIEQIIYQLGYYESKNLIKSSQFQSTDLKLYTRKILQEINPYAAYIVNDLPFVLFFDKTVNDDIYFGNISKKLWNAQVPVAIFCDSNTVKIFNGLSINKYNKLNKITEYALNNCTEESDFSYWEIASPHFWNKHVQEYSKNNLNQSLLDNIYTLTNKLKEEYSIKFATKLVLRLIFIRYLIDRGIDLDYGNFSCDVKKSQKEFLEIVKNKNALYKLFTHLKSKFNGNLFELENELECKELTDNVCLLLSEFLSGRILLDSGQYALFDMYDFNIIPVELISNIYEILLGKEKQQRDNAFYTPNYLVNYILDKTVMKTLTEKSMFTILDPACGSGVFLVDSYRRIVENHLGGKSYCEDDNLLKQLLTQNIYGIDINEDAIDITIFSLYLTVLDYKDPKTLSKFALPNLKGKNLFVSDFFDKKSLKPLMDQRIEFDFIIGNPPWGNDKNGMHINYCQENEYTYMQQNNEICRSFIFRAKDFSNENTICCFILHSKILYNRQQPAVNFRKFLLKETTIYNVIELSSVRKLVFENADAPAVIISFKYSNQQNLNNKFIYTAVKKNIFFRLFHVLLIEKNDIKFIPQGLLYNYDWAWKTIVYGFSQDINNIIKLKEKYCTINDILKNATPPFVVGTGIQSYIGDAQDASELLDLPLLDAKNGIDHFSVNIDKENIFRKPKIHRVRNRELFNPPHCFTSKGVNCANYKMRSVLSEDEVICTDAVHIIKGSAEQRDILFNMVGLFNSSLFAYFNLMLGSSIGIEREQRFMKEVLEFPYVFCDNISTKVKCIQELANNDNILSGYNRIDEEIEELDNIILNAYGLQDNKFVDYAINIQIPELTSVSDINVYRKVTVDELKMYSKCFQNYFSKIYSKYDKGISIILYPNVGKYYAVFELIIVEGKNNLQVVVSDKTNEDKELLTKFSVYSHNDKFYQLRDIINFGENSFYIIKPNFYKNWHPAIAEIDLADVIDEITSTSGGDE